MSQATPNPIEPLRQQIDQIDTRIVHLLNERARIVVEIGQHKRNSETPVYAPDREAQIFDRLREANRGPLPDKCLEAVWREIMSGCRALEHPLRVAYLGPPGSFSHLTARKQFGGSVHYESVEDIAGVFTAVAPGHADLGLVPIENSAIGGIGETLDSFLHHSVQVVAEALITVHHHVLSFAEAEKVTHVYSKPEVFAQCRHWLANHLRQAQRVPVASSSKAAEMAALDKNTAAIGSSLAAEVYGLPVLYPNVEDDPNNTTRFFIIGRHAPAPTGDDKTALMFTTAHKPGALAEVLDVLRDQGVNLTHIDKRPSKRVNWEYTFFIDIVGHQKDAPVARALEETRKHCLHMTVLGSFPRAKDAL